jgi:hypothetical protein
VNSHSCPVRDGPHNTGPRCCVLRLPAEGAGCQRLPSSLALVCGFDRSEVEVLSKLRYLERLLTESPCASQLLPIQDSFCMQWSCWVPLPNPDAHVRTVSTRLQVLVIWLQKACRQKEILSSNRPGIHLLSRGFRDLGFLGFYNALTLIHSVHLNSTGSPGSSAWTCAIPSQTRSLIWGVSQGASSSATGALEEG